jgi:hypothetical protein
MIPGTFPIIASTVRREIIFQSTLFDGTSRVTHTFNGQTFGDDDPTRQILVMTLMFSAPTITIGGVSATVYNPGGAGRAIYMALANPTGTTGTIEVSATSSVLGGAYWTVYGMSPTIVDSDNSEDLVLPATNNASVSLVAGGAWFAYAQASSSNVAVSGITNDFSASLSSAVKVMGGSELTSAAGTGTASVTVSNNIGALSLGPF